jgi:hypothetical protein
MGTCCISCTKNYNTDYINIKCKVLRCMQTHTLQDMRRSILMYQCIYTNNKKQADKIYNNYLNNPKDIQIYENEMDELCKSFYNNFDWKKLRKDLIDEFKSNDIYLI